MRSCVLIILFFSLNAFAAPLRVKLPDYSLTGASPKENGELVYNQGKVLVSRFENDVNSYVDINMEESLPGTVKTATSIYIGDGTIFFDNKVYRGTASPISCSLTTSGLGGYEISAPSTPQIMYLYLLLDESGAGLPSLSCIISPNDSGPQSSPANTMPWRRLYSFWSTAIFTSVGEKVFYASGADSTFNTTSPSACTPIPLSKISSITQRARLKLTCATGGSSNYTVYTDSTCSANSSLGVCSSTSLWPQYLEYSPMQILYYKGVVGAVQTVAIQEINDQRAFSQEMDSKK